MAVKLKPLREQTIVVTGATSGIGLATAKAAAAAGARLVLAARSEEDLRRLEREISAAGGQVAVVPADVGDRAQVRRIADAAVDRFGSIDTWVNDAGLSIWGRLEAVPEEDHRRLFETNFWGMVHGSLEACRLLKARRAGGCGGAIINLGSLASDQAFPLQGMYCASKHAIKGFTDSLRMELEEEGAPISVTLIKPAGIDTPFTEHAANYMDKEPALPPPLYKPQDVADAILHAATRPTRDVFVGSASKTFSSTNRAAPRLNDVLMENTMVSAQQKDQPGTRRRGSLYEPGRGLRVRGDNEGLVHSSLYTRAALHPVLTAAVLGAAGLALTGLISSSRTPKGDWRRAARRVGSRLSELLPA